MEATPPQSMTRIKTCAFSILSRHISIFLLDSMFKIKWSKSREKLEFGVGGFEHLNASTRHVPRSEKDLWSRIPRIQDPRSWRILDLIFSFSHGILKILDHIMATCRKIPGILDLRQKRFGWILEIQPGRVIVRSCRSWILHNNSATASWVFFTSNEFYLLVPHM